MRFEARMNAVRAVIQRWRTQFSDPGTDTRTAKIAFIMRA